MRPGWFIGGLSTCSVRTSGGRPRRGAGCRPSRSLCSLCRRRRVPRPRPCRGAGWLPGARFRQRRRGNGSRSGSRRGTWRRCRRRIRVLRVRRLRLRRPEGELARKQLFSSCFVEHQHDHISFRATDLKPYAAAFHFDRTGGGPAYSALFRQRYEAPAELPTDDEPAFSGPERSPCTGARLSRSWGMDLSELAIISDRTVADAWRRLSASVAAESKAPLAAAQLKRTANCLKCIVFPSSRDSTLQLST